eukprot:349716-Chlamydomonas_euryale.AAC.2
MALNGVARMLRAARFAGGALRLDNTKLFFKMDKDGNPDSTAPYVQVWKLLAWACVDILHVLACKSLCGHVLTYWMCGRGPFASYVWKFCICEYGSCSRACA